MSSAKTFIKQRAELMVASDKMNWFITNLAKLTVPADSTDEAELDDTATNASEVAAATTSKTAPVANLGLELLLEAHTAAALAADDDEMLAQMLSVLA